MDELTLLFFGESPIITFYSYYPIFNFIFLHISIFIVKFVGKYKKKKRKILDFRNYFPILSDFLTYIYRF